MKLEQQVCSLELAKKLKELGVKQESLFNWVNTSKPRLEDSRMVGCGRCGSVMNGIPLPMSVERFSAFTVAELGELLPPHYFTTKSQEIKNFWHCNIIENFAGDEFKKGIIANTEADARAKMLIYLLENKLISLN